MSREVDHVVETIMDYITHGTEDMDRGGYRKVLETIKEECTDRINALDEDDIADDEETLNTPEDESN